MPTPHPPLIPVEFPLEEIKRDARTIRAILRKYSPDPSSYTGFLPLHPVSVGGVNRTHGITAADHIDSIYGREYIYSLFDWEAVGIKG